MGTVDELQRALDRIQKLSSAKCMGVSDRKRLLFQISEIARDAFSNLPDSEIVDSIIGKESKYG